MTWQYAWQWNDLLDEPMDPLTEDEARARHESGELYTAYSLYEDGAISTAVEVRLENGYVGVLDFDRYSRLVWDRTLDQRGDRMFMEDAYSYDYGDSAEHLLRNQSQEFFHRHLEPDGTGYERRHVKGDPMEERTGISLKEGATLDHYWVPVPGFGDYDEVCLAGIDREGRQMIAGALAEDEQDQDQQDGR